MTHAYRSLLDRVEIAYAGGKYRVIFKKLITPIGPEKTESVFAKIDVSVFPDDPELTNLYYARTPLKLNELSFRATAHLEGQLVPLYWRVIKQHASCIEIDISLRERTTDRTYALASNQSILVEYGIEISRRLWGNYLERHIMRPIDRLEVSLRFPATECKIIKGWKHHFGVPSDPILPNITTFTNGDITIMDWSLDNPTMNDRFRFYWYFTDGFENRLQEDFKKLETRRRLFTADGGSVLVEGRPYGLSDAQRRCLEVLFQAMAEGEILHQSEILRRAGLTKTKRLKDIFSHHAAWNAIIRSNGKARFVIDPQIKIER